MSKLILVIFLLATLSPSAFAASAPVAEFTCQAYGASIPKEENAVFFKAEEKAPGYWTLNKIYSNGFVLNVRFDKTRSNEATVTLGKNGQLVFFTTVVMINWGDVLILAPFSFDGINVSCEYPVDANGLPL